jgi:uncharacterized repeat protein (TIGR03803 family)
LSVKRVLWKVAEHPRLIALILGRKFILEANAGEWIMKDRGSVLTIIVLALFATVAHLAVAQESILYSFGYGGYCSGGPTSAVIFDSKGNLYGTCNAGQVYELSPVAGGGWTRTEIYTATGGGDPIGSSPSGLIFDAKKVNLYGVSDGGDYSDGAVFELSPAAGGGWTQTVLHSFQYNGDGSTPMGGVIQDASGNIYGTTYEGAQFGGGVVFELTPQTDGTWTETILHSFETNGSDGNAPTASLILDAKGNLYGTTYYGGNGAGAESGFGIFFELTPQKDGTWTEQILYNFGATSTDAKNPLTALVFDTAGNLYGTSREGGANGDGSVYELSPAAGGGWTERVLYSFGATATDGNDPRGGLVLDTQGNLYGTTINGGLYNNNGTIYELTPAGGGAWAEKVLYNFDNSVGNDGYTPASTLTLDSAGNLYGTTNQGGAYEPGTVFEFKPEPTAATPAFSPAAGTYATAQTVDITDTTPNATIYYTTNGTTPNSSSTKYTTSITVSATETIEAIAVAANYANSAVALATYAIEAQAATPVFSVASGTYKSAQTVAISDTTPGATIYYTTNGSTPTPSSTKYTAAISVTSTETIEAIAVASGFTNSETASASYTIQTPTAATPVFSPAVGTYASAQSVTISDSTTGATIYYTTNGTTPTISSTKYTGAITVSASEIIEAFAVATGYTNSAVASATYTITPPAATPVFSPAAGTYTSAQSVTITDATTDAAVYYTANGTTPSTASTKYTGAISVTSTETIRAIAVATGYTNSAVASATYTIQKPTVATPDFSPAAGAYTSTQSVSITNSSAGATIYYTTNGTTPTTSSTKYSGAITVSATETIEALAIATGDTNSAVASATYTINVPTAATPVFSPTAGTYTSVQSISITDATAGSAIYYTTNGTTPTISSSKYSGAITVSATETIEAIAVATGYTNSAVASATYTINLPAPSFSITVSPASLTIAPGKSGMATLSITPQNGFASATTFSCSGLPSGASCSFSPATVTPSGGAAATTTLTVSDSSSTSVLRNNSHPMFPGEIPGATLAIALCCFGWRRRRNVQLLMLLVVAALFGATLMTGCGGSSTPKAKTSAVTVIATSGTIQQTAPLSVTIQ